MDNIFKSPFGNLYIYADKTGICKISLQKDQQLEHMNFDINLVKETQNQLSEYFKQQRTSFTLPLSYQRQTQLQKEVLQTVDDIAYAQTMTYKQVASHTSSPNAIRAIASHIANNPYPIIIPCHRVIHSQESQTPRYIWGIEIKQFLVQHEKNSLIES